MTYGDIIILHKCTKNDDHMLYCSWDMVYDRYKCYFSFWAIFCSFNPSTAQIIKISEKWKKIGDIIIIHKCSKNHDYMLHCSWDMVYDGCNCYVPFFGYFYPFNPSTAQIMRISEKWKKIGDIIILHKFSKNHDHMLHCSWDMVHDGCNCYVPFLAIFTLLPP